MSSSQLAKSEGAAEVSAVLMHGDISKLTPAQKNQYYLAVCESLGLNPLTKPLEFLKLNGRELLYAKKDATDQLRKKYGISITIVSRETLEGVYTVTARASTPDGRTDEDCGSINIAGLKGDALANALMKAQTKAKRRVTLSICGLGFMDESELETVPSYKPKAEIRTLADVANGEVEISINDAMAALDQCNTSAELEAWADTFKEWAKKLPPAKNQYVKDIYKAKMGKAKERENGGT